MEFEDFVFGIYPESENESESESEDESEFKGESEPISKIKMPKQDGIHLNEGDIGLESKHIKYFQNLNIPTVIRAGSIHIISSVWLFCVEEIKNIREDDLKLLTLIVSDGICESIQIVGEEANRLCIEKIL